MISVCNVTGVILRDSHGVAQVRFVTGNKILRILKKKGMAPDLPEDLYHLIKKAVNIRKHMERNRKVGKAHSPVYCTSTYTKRIDQNISLSCWKQVDAFHCCQPWIKANRKHQDFTAQREILWSYYCQITFLKNIISRFLLIISSNFQLCFYTCYSSSLCHYSLQIAS